MEAKMQNIDVNQAKQLSPELIEAHLPVGGGASLDWAYRQETRIL